MSNTFDKLSVLDSFIEEVNSYLPEIETNFKRLAQSPDDMDALEETYRRTHTIGGSASMMDFPGLAHVAHGMEDILGDVLDGVTLLDPLALGFLQRSLGRLRQLVRGIHDRVDENAVIAEDDADYTEYRTALEASTQVEQQKVVTNEQAVGTQQLAPAESALPSLDEMLASFRTPTAAEDIDWPEEPGPVSDFAERAEQPTQPVALTPAGPSQQHRQPSTLEMLAAPTSQSTTAPLAPTLSSKEKSSTAKPSGTSEGRQAELVPVRAQSGASESTLPHVYQEMREEAQALEAQSTSLKNIVAQLQTAASVIETQRTEFRSFLDGSKDALDRMEEWAGRAMGLNLRNSPEHVRRYLPLSVMWVANSKLKKALELLTQITHDAGTADEQMQSALRQLQVSVEACGQAFQQLQADKSSRVLTQEPGWTPWEMQVARDGGTVQERVTFERRGDLQGLRAEVEAQVREELHHEYESRPFTLAARTVLERQVREEVLREFEAKRRLEEHLSGSEKQETLQEMEARLRNEIEIQVRREFLNNLTDRLIGTEAEREASRFPTPPELSAPQTSNFADRAREAVELIAPAPTKTVPESTPSAAFASISPAPSMSTFASELGEEAAEIFRLEAEEHLQTISVRVAALEKSPTDHDLIQGIRRATHTLKGAAGMMGFRAIADLCHISEDLLDSVMEGAITVSPTVVSLILDTAEALDLLINGERSEVSDEAKVQSLRVRYVELLGDQTSPPIAVDEEIDAEIEENAAIIIEDAAVTNVVAGTQSGMQQAARGDLSVRVPLHKLDELVNLFGELLVNRSVLEERLQRLMRLVSDASVSSTRLRDVGQKLESRFEAATLPSGHSVQVMPGQGDQSMGYNFGGNGKNPANRAGASHLAEFDELELDRYTEFHQLARGLSEGISDMTTLSNEMEAIIRDCESVFGRENRLSTTFQDRLMKARLVPLSTMIPRLYRTARAVALKQHKEFEFVLEGQETEVDRTVIEEIAGPLLHLMRNAVNHAIETPEVRAQKGKPPAGQIKLSAAYEGNQVVITVRDDGTGIDPDRVRNAAIDQNIIHPNQALSDSDVVDLIFR